MGTHRRKPNSEPSSLTIVEKLRAAIRDSGETEYGIGKAAGVSQSVINRFVNGERGIALETAARLCSYLKLTLSRTPNIESKVEQIGL